MVKGSDQEYTIRLDNPVVFTIPLCVKHIGENAFENCYDLNTVIIPSGVVSIGRWAFCLSSIQEVDMADSVTTVEDGVFYGCKNLTSVRLSQSIKVLSDKMFENCKQLTTISLKQDLLGWHIAFQGAGLNTVTVISKQPRFSIKDVKTRMHETCRSITENDRKPSIIMRYLVPVNKITSSMFAKKSDYRRILCFLCCLVKIRDANPLLGNMGQPEILARVLNARKDISQKFNYKPSIEGQVECEERAICYQIG